MKKNPADSTLRNVKAGKKRLAAANTRIISLETKVKALAKRVAVLEQKG